MLATEPNQVWSWDITKLKSHVKWTYFYLYVIMDIFSRYVVGWMVAHREQTALAKRLIQESCLKQNIPPGQLGLHADRGVQHEIQTLDYGIANDVYDQRQKTLEKAYLKNPSRFKGKIPMPPALPEAAWINKPKQKRE